MSGKNMKRLPFEFLTDIYLSLMLLIYPLWVGPGGYIDITPVKYRFFVTVTIVYLVINVLLMAELTIIGKSREVFNLLRRPHLTKLLLLSFILCCCLSALFSDYGVKTWVGLGRYEGLSTYILYFSLFVAVSIFGRFKDLHLYLLGMAVIINAVIGLFQYSGLNPFGLFPQGYTYHDAFVLYANQFMGTIGNVDILSSFLSISVPIFLVKYIITDNGKVFILPFIAGMLLLLLSGVNAGLLGIIVGFILLFPLLLDTKEKFIRSFIAAAAMAFLTGIYFCIRLTYLNRVTELSFVLNIKSMISYLMAALLILVSILIKLKKTKNPWNPKKIRIILYLLIGVGMIIGLAVIVIFPFSGGTLYEAQQVLKGNISSSFGSGRIRIWQESFKLLPGHLLFGGGPDTLAARIGFSFTRYSDLLGIQLESKIDNAHNDYLNILVNTGLPSLVLYLSALGTCIIKAIRNCDTKTEILIPLAAVLCYSIQIFFNFSICTTAPFFWISLAFCDKLTHEEIIYKGNKL